MSKYLVLAAVAVAALFVANDAQARGRRGCPSCATCPGGVCAVPMAAAPAAAPAVVTDAPAEPAAAVAAAPAVAPVMAAPAASYRRFGFRR